MFPSAFPSEKQMAELTAKIFLELGAVNVRPDLPFLFTSGWASPVYIDCRKIISFPRVRQTLMDFAASLILRSVGFESFDAVAGGETAGIPYAAWIADRLMLPMQYVRKKPKGYSRGAQIEGAFREGDRILLVEDLTTDGRSKMIFCEALRKAGAVVGHAFVLFYYDIFPQTREMMEKMGIQMLYLATWWDILEQSKKNGSFDVKTLEEMEKFLHDPIEWSSAHGGIARFPAL